MKKQHIVLIILILWHGFIFGHSLMPGSVSSVQSGVVVDILEPVIKVVAPNIARDAMHLIIRKSGHFIEFGILGFLLYMTYKKKFSNYLLALVVLGHGLLVAITDESIQLLIPNRAGQITDVLIDFSGVLIAFVICFISGFLINKFRSRKVINWI